MFKVLGILLMLYTAHAIHAGEVFAKSGASGATVSRAESPKYFWTVVLIYACLSVALLTIF
jgi:hypothetical protein